MSYLRAGTPGRALTWRSTRVRVNVKKHASTPSVNRHRSSRFPFTSGVSTFLTYGQDSYCVSIRGPHI